MITARHLMSAFTVNAQGILGPIGVNIFSFKHTKSGRAKNNLPQRVIIKVNVAILGASDKPQRYSYKAMCLLEEYGHRPVLIHPRLKEVGSRKVYASLDQVKEPIHTLAMYVNSKISSQLNQEIIELSPERVIFNPGSENFELAEELEKSGVKVVQGCVLVMLNTGTF